MSNLATQLVIFSLVTTIVYANVSDKVIYHFTENPPLGPFSLRLQEETPYDRWELTTGGRSPSCGKGSQSKPVESSVCFQHAARSLEERCRTTLSFP